MKTSEYAWYRPDFPEYNIAQKAVIPYCSQDVNMVVCFGTAVGKTVIGECCLAYHLQNAGRKTAYISPYRSLCSEKFTKWQDDLYLSPYGVAIRTGEVCSLEDELESGRLTVMTCEAFDVRVRSFPRWSNWVQDLDCVVFDEAHFIGDRSRGVSLESAILRLTSLNPDCRLVLLSATMQNALEVAKWIKSLNGKGTKCFTSNWAPNKVEISRTFVETGWEIADKVVEEVSNKRGKTIIFVHSKNVGRDIVKKLQKAKIKAVFHNASVSKAQREKIEIAFNDPSSRLDVLVSTSTLGAGVNMG